MSLLRKALLVNTSEFICLVLALGQNILLARLLGPAGVGRYDLLYAAMHLVASIAALGLPTALLYYTQRDPERATQYLMSTVWSILALSTAAGGILVLVILVVRDYFGFVPWYALVGVWLYLPFVLERVTARNVLLIKIEAWRLGAMSVCSAGANVLAIVATYALGVFEWPDALLCLVFGTAVGMVTGWWWAGRRLDIRVSPGWRTIRQLLVMGIRQNWVDVMVMVNAQVSIMVVKWMMESFEDVGYFTRGQRVGMLVVTAGQAVLPLLFSRWASLPEDRVAPHVEKVVRFASTFGLVSVVGVVLTGRWIILLMYGHRFLPAVGPMVIMVPGAVCYLLSSVLIQVLGSRGRPELSAFSLALAAIVNALLSFALTPRWGINGAAVAALAGNLVLLVPLMVIVKRVSGVRLWQCLGLRRADILSLLQKRLKRT